MTRPSETTREKIIRSSARVFAQHGYDGASVRSIVSHAGVNQAAINYHFGSKEGLYRAVLQTAVQALLADDDSVPAPETLSREAALRRFVRQQLRPLTARDELSQFLRVFHWEQLRPSPTFRKFMAEEATPFLGVPTALVRRFLPEGASDRQALLATLWLFGQCSIFVRSSEQLAHPPMSLTVDGAFVEMLADTIATWAAAGLQAQVSAA